MSRRRRARWARNIRPLFTVYMPVLGYVLFALFPLYFMLVTSLKSNAELYDVNAVPFWIARGLTGDHYGLLSTDTPFWNWFANTLIVTMTLNFPQIVLLETSLSFLGVGIQPPMTSLGNMVGFGRDYLLTAWWIAIFPAATIFLGTLAISLLGDWARDKLDPTLR